MKTKAQGECHVMTEAETNYAAIGQGMQRFLTIPEAKRKARNLRESMTL